MEGWGGWERIRAKDSGRRAREAKQCLHGKTSTLTCISM